MIAFDRGDEPEELVRIRDQRLASAALRGRPNTFDGYDSDAVRAALLPAQEYRCAYCEGKVEPGDPIEHQHPKAGADSVDWDIANPPSDLASFFAWFSEGGKWKVRREGGYWWLAWTWENLIYSCGPCNSVWKGNWFPLERGSSALPERAAPSRGEGALLLDPTCENPLDHLRFAPDLVDSSSALPLDWGPVPLTERGRWTLAVLGLHRRPGLRTRWKIAARQVLEDPDFQAAQAAVRRREFDVARPAWQRAQARLLGGTPAPDYLALRWCVFDHSVPEGVRALASPPLELPRPRVVALRTPRPLEEPRTDLAHFPEPLRVRIRAVGPRVDDRTMMEELLCAICAERPCTADEITAWLRRDDAAALERTWLRPLAAALPPRLVKDAATRMWSVPVVLPPPIG